MSLAWGWPWHGLVTGNMLALDGGVQKPYPSPAPYSYQLNGTTISSRDSYGNTYRLAVPGVQATERTSGEQAADAAAGYQWRNEAMLSGGRFHLYGRPLDGWIYVDPDGVRWWVRCSELGEATLRSLASPLSVPVTLARFGDFGVAAETYSYTVSLPLDQLGVGGSAVLLVDALKPDGSAAVIHCGQRGQVRVPSGFIELRLAGPGAAATVSAVILRTYAQVQQIDAAPIPLQLWLNDDATYAWAETYPPNPYRFAHELIGSFQRASRYVLALWYDANGLVEEVALHFVGQYQYSAPRPPLNSLGGVLDYTNASSMTGTLELRRGGVVVDSVGVVVAIQAQFVSMDNVTKWTYSVSLGGVEMTGAQQEAGGNANTPFPEIGYVMYGMGSAHYQASTVGRSSFNFFPEIKLGSGAGFRASVTPYFYSRQVLGFELVDEAGTGNQPSTRRWRYRPPITPSGLAAGQIIDLIQPAAPTFYGSHDPYTGNSVWGQSAPVCYV
jgi:hypothetical protein